MIDHISLGTQHYAGAVAFYSRVLAPLNLSLQRDTGKEAAFGNAQAWSFFLYPQTERVTAPGTHVQSPSCRVFCSQPFMRSPSQSAQPEKHAPISHMLLLQTASAWGGSSHGFRHSPQLSGSVERS